MTAMTTSGSAGLARPLVMYTLGRVLCFAVPLALLWAFGITGVLSLAIALVISVPLSYVLLRRQRDRLTAALQERGDRRAVQREQFRSQLRGD